MNLVSDEMIRRATVFLGHELTAEEVDEFRRMSELLGEREDDIAWALVMAMWAGRAETTNALHHAREGVRVGLEAWMDRVGVDLKTIDENRRAMTREAAAEAGKSAAEIHRAVGQGTANLASGLEELESKVAKMMATVGRAMAGATGTLAAAEKRDLDVHSQIEALADKYASRLSDEIGERARTTLADVEWRLDTAAKQAELAAKPLLLLAGVAMFFLVLGVVSTTLLFVFWLPRT